MLTWQESDSHNDTIDLKSLTLIVTSINRSDVLEYETKANSPLTEMSVCSESSLGAVILLCIYRSRFFSYLYTYIYN